MSSGEYKTGIATKVVVLGGKKDSPVAQVASRRNDNALEDLLAQVSAQPDDEPGKWAKAMAAQVTDRMKRGCSSCQRGRAIRKIRYYLEEAERVRRGETPLDSNMDGA